jgi:hypothetical protein
MYEYIFCWKTNYFYIYSVSISCFFPVIAKPEAAWKIRTTWIGFTEFVNLVAPLTAMTNTVFLEYSTVFFV